MGCFGDREKGPTKQSQKWDFITLSDFKATSAWNTVAYAWLWILFLSTIVIYAVDTFTAINLLIFNKWASQVKPYIPFEYSKWIFAGCIIFSWILWGFEWLRAIRVIRRAGVAESYMDPLAVELQSMRKQGWRRFLVFAALTKSKKGADLIAFFAYFSFKGAIRIIVAEGPRQVINTLTLIAVVKADFDKSTSGSSGIGLFWANLQQMWIDNKYQAIIIFSMMYSLAIWAISIICLATAAILYIIFLWHYIPTQDGGLAGYCRRKIDKRLARIVEGKVKAAIEEEEKQRRKAEEKQLKAGLKAEKKGKVFNPDDKAAITRQPTLPQLDDDTASQPALERQNTINSVSTLPQYDSRPGTRNENRPPLPGYPADRPYPPARSATMNSQWTAQNYDADAPLLANAAQAGESMSRPGTAFSRQESSAGYGAPMMSRQMSAAQRSYTPGAAGPPRMPAADGQRPYSPGPGPRMPDADGQRPYSPAPGPRMPGADGQRSYSPAPYSPGPRMPGSENQRSFSPMLRTDFSQTSNVGPQSATQRTASPWSAGPRPDSPAGRMPMERSNTGSTGIDRPNPALTRQQTFGSVSSAASLSRPQPAQKSNFNRPFTPASTSDAVSPIDSNSYEMKPNPYTSRKASNDESASPSTYVAFSATKGKVDTPASSTYTAFNPNRTASPAPIQPPAPLRTNTATTDYFAAKAPLATAVHTAPAPPADNRQTFGYSDLVSGYGAKTPSPPPPPPGKDAYANNRF